MSDDLFTQEMSQTENNGPKSSQNPTFDEDLTLAQKEKIFQDFVHGLSFNQMTKNHNLPKGKVVCFLKNMRRKILYNIDLLMTQPNQKIEVKGLELSSH